MVKIPTEMTPTDTQIKHTQILADAKHILTQYLAARKLRKTPERYAILEGIYAQETHFDVETLHKHMQSTNQYVSRATLYNCLELLLDCGLIARNHFSKNKSLYEKSYGYRQHDHLICTDCKRIVEFREALMDRIEQRVGGRLGFDIVEHTMLLYGKCKRTDCTHKDDPICP